MKDKAKLTKLIIGFEWGHLSSIKKLSYSIFPGHDHQQHKSTLPSHVFTQEFTAIWMQVVCDFFPPHTFLFSFKAFSFFLSPPWPLHIDTSAPEEREWSDLKIACLSVLPCLRDLLTTVSHYRRPLQWSSHLHGGSPTAGTRTKKLDLSRELNVPSVSTILLIFHQSCGSSS